MNYNESNQHWQHDIRLKNISPDRIQSLTDIANSIRQAPPDQRLNIFLSLQKKYIESGNSFTTEERDMIISVLTEHMTPEEKKKVQMIQKLTAQMHNKRK